MTRLTHVRWLGGGSGAGKTTVARQLARRFGARLYGCDETIGAHSAQLSTAAAPLLAEFRRMTMDERWVARDPMTMYTTFPWFHGEGFDLLIRDLRKTPTDRVVVAEGFRLLPHLVQPHVSDQSHAVWLIPTPAFRRQALRCRDPSATFWQRTSHPLRAFANLVERDRIFTEAVEADAVRHGFDTVRVDGTRPVDDLVQDVAHRFGLRS